MLQRLLRKVGWQSSDWRAREQAAYAMTDESRLLHMALHDVSEEVRTAAVKTLARDDCRWAVIRESTCERTRKMAVSRLANPQVLIECALASELPVGLRIAAAERLELPEDVLADLAAEDQPEGLRLHAIQRMPPGESLDALYHPALSMSLKRVLVPRLQGQGILRRVVEGEVEGSLRSLAIAQLVDQRMVLELFLHEECSATRSELAERIAEAAIALEAFSDERDPLVRLRLVEHGRLGEHLDQVARTDPDARVRSAAIERLPEGSTLLEAALHDPDPRVCAAASLRLEDNDRLVALAMKASFEDLRWQTVDRIQDTAALERLAKEAPHADVRWRAARRLGRMPIEAIGAINSDEVLQRLLEEEEPLVRALAAWRMKSAAAIESLAVHEDPRIRAIGLIRRHELANASSMRFVPIADRPYMMGAFPVTRAQVRDLLGAHARWEGGDDLPATDLTRAEALRLCSELQRRDGNAYRLPSLEEWRHAAFADDPSWTKDFPDALRDRLTRLALHVDGGEPRPLSGGWPNPWGLLDMLGNVSVLVDDEIGDLSWVDALRRHDALSRNAPDGSAYALAAGFNWGDRVVRTDRCARLVPQPYDEISRGKVGVRLLREGNPALPQKSTFRLSLQSEPGWGLSREEVTENLVRSKLFTREQVTAFWKVAPVVLTSTPDYRTLLPKKRRLEQAGALVAVTSSPDRG